LTVAGLLVRAITQYRHYEVMGPAEPDGNPTPPVTVIVPARNEAANIGRCVTALLNQEDLSDLRVIVIDDCSEDQTPEIVRELANSDARVQTLSAPALPPGWRGKPHACDIASRHAVGGDWLCFIDADTTAEPPLLRTALRVARERNLDLLSLQPFQELISPWERLILPTGFFLIAFTQDLRKTNDPALPEAAVNGQFMLARRHAYDAVGGHEGVRDQLAEDSALASNFKSAGFRVAVIGTRGLLHTRMYSDLRSLWEGTARQAATLLTSSVALLLAALLALVLAWAAIAMPAWAMTAVMRAGGSETIIALVASLAGSLALFGTHIGAVRYFRIPFWYGLLFPIGYTLGAAILVWSVWQKARGRVAWKGRIYAESTGAASRNMAHAVAHPEPGAGR